MLYSKIEKIFFNSISTLPLVFLFFCINTGVSAQRIVTLAPSLGELVAEFGYEEFIVGVSENSSYPLSLSRKKNIGPYSRFNLEEVVALKPDLVIGTMDGNSKDQIEHLRSLGLRVVVISTLNLADIGKSYEKIGLVLAKEELGKRLRIKFEEGLKKIREIGVSKNSSSPRAMLQLNWNPLIVAGGGCFLNDVMTAIGLNNVYRDLKSSYPKVNLEDVVNRNPDLILIMDFHKDLKSTHNEVNRWKIFPKLKAIAENKVFVISDERLLRPTARILDGMVDLKKVLSQ